MEALITNYNNFINCFKNNIPSETIKGCFNQIFINKTDSKTTVIAKVVAPLALAGVSAYFFPVASVGAAKYMIKGAVFLGAYVLSLPFVGALMSAAKAASQIVLRYLRLEGAESTAVSIVKQIALPAIAAAAVYYFFPERLVLTLTTRQVAVLFTFLSTYIVFDKLINPRGSLSTGSARVLPTANRVDGNAPAGSSAASASPAAASSSASGAESKPTPAPTPVPAASASSVSGAPASATAP
jgi:hypothetical protein